MFQVGSPYSCTDSLSIPLEVDSANVMSPLGCSGILLLLIPFLLLLSSLPVVPLCVHLGHHQDEVPFLINRGCHSVDTSPGPSDLPQKTCISLWAHFTWSCFIAVILLGKVYRHLEKGLEAATWFLSGWRRHALGITWPWAYLSFESWVASTQSSETSSAKLSPASWEFLFLEPDSHGGTCATLPKRKMWQAETMPGW